LKEPKPYQTGLYRPLQELASKDRRTPAGEKLRARTWFWYWAKRNPCVVASLLSTRSFRWWCACIAGFQYLSLVLPVRVPCHHRPEYRETENNCVQETTRLVVYYEISQNWITVPVRCPQLPCLCAQYVLKPRERKPCSKVCRGICVVASATDGWAGQLRRPPTPWRLGLWAALPFCCEILRPRSLKLRPCLVPKYFKIFRHIKYLDICMEH
jgi:hypothetical protein